MFIIMFKNFLLGLALCVWFCDPAWGQASPASPPPATIPKAATTKEKWEKEITAIEERAKASPPAKQGILFTGSSSVRLWDLKTSFPDLPAVNHGFGDSEMSDLVRYGERLITPYQPATVVLYSGDNDLANGKTPMQIAADLDEVLNQLRRELPQARVIVLGIKPSPQRWALYEQQQAANALMQERIAARMDQAVQFFDTAILLLDSENKPRAEFYEKDELHLNAKGYQQWEAALRPLLKSKPSRRLEKSK